MEDAYFAGLLDGEGHFGIQKHTTKKNTYEGVIQVNMTCKKTIGALVERFGGHIYIRHPPAGKPHHQMQWRWRVKAAKARAVLKAVHPHLITKREAADKMIAMWKERGLW